MYTFDDIRKKGLLLFEVKRGSHAFGLATEKSDIDTGGVYIAEPNVIYGIRNLENTSTEYQKQIASEKNDDVWYELGVFMELLSKSNPTALELLFAADDCIIYEHPMFHEFRMHRNEFISRDTVRVLSKYATSQIRKARGLNKKIVTPIEERKTPIDFCYTFNGKQGTMPVEKWLEERGLKQKYCGLNHLPNMDMWFGCYYDWQEHMHLEWKSGDEMYDAWMNSEEIGEIDRFVDWCCGYLELPLANRELFNKVYNEAVPKGYHGIQREDGTSTMVRLDSIVKGDKPICHFGYNDNGFQTHCRQYKEYQEWKKIRNEERYKGNLGHNYDSKNMSHTIRLLTMALEIAEGKGLILDRRIAGDRDYLLAIKNHEYEYEEVIELSDMLYDEIESIKDTCDLPDNTPFSVLDNLLIEFRTKFYEQWKQ